MEKGARAFFAFLFTERLFTTISEPGTGYGLAARCILTRKAAVDSKHTELAVKGTEYSPAEPGLAVPCPAGYRTVGNTVDSTGKIKKEEAW